MSRPPLQGRISRPLALAALPALLLLACGKPPEDGAARVGDAWTATDLWERPVELPSDESIRPERSEPATIRNRAVRALRIAPGTTIGWRLTLGAEPFLTFRPVPVGTCRFQVDVVTADEARTEVLKRPFSGETEKSSLLPEVVVDLESVAKRPIELWLSVPETPECREAHWATPIVFSRAATPVSGERFRPDILLIGTDTLRTDVLGLYGRQPSVTPSLDRFGARSDVYLDAFSTNNSTNPGFSSLMTGFHSRDHGVYDQRTRLSDDARTLAELLSDSGYSTRGIVSARHLGRISGIDQGFEELVVPRQQFFAETVVQQALAWIEEDAARLAEGSETAGDDPPPRFTFLHLFDPHIPHNPPEPFAFGEVPGTPMALRSPETWFAYRERGLLPLGRQSPRGLEGHTDAYPADVAYLDRQLGRLFAFLESRRILDHTVVALVADHGETLGEEEHFFDHASLTDVVTHVPLIVHWPGQTEGRRIPGLVQHFDLFPTLLEAAGAPVPEAQLGRSLRRPDRRRVVVAEGHRGETAMIRTARWKLIETRNGIRLHDLREDPGEEVDLAGTGLPVESELKGTLDRWRRDRRPLDGTSRVELTAEERAELEALGYVE